MKLILHADKDDNPSFFRTQSSKYGMASSCLPSAWSTSMQNLSLPKYTIVSPWPGIENSIAM
ncbi:MAG TPA: hypothetical protein VE957_15930 [Terriglobales bacterium]|nr:hypothetical protein [Terriglobales bacterium]